MHLHRTNGFEHDHAFLSDSHLRSELRTKQVVALSIATMAAEIWAGLLFGSMALLADGLHMATHAGALALAAAAYAYARRHKDDPRFAFGTGKFGDLAAFASGIVLLLTALAVGWESAHRFIVPGEVRFEEAIAVAVIGLLVNVAGAWLLHDSHGHDDPSHVHHDHNHHAAYMHVLADALTSVLAIAGLIAGRFLGWNWMDPAVGFLGAIIIGRWSLQLMKNSGAVLLDAAVDPALSIAIRRLVEARGDQVADLHVWRVGPGHTAAILSLVSRAPLSPEEYKERLRHLRNLCHVTIEVHRAA